MKNLQINEKKKNGKLKVEKWIHSGSWQTNKEFDSTSSRLDNERNSFGVFNVPEYLNRRQWPISFFLFSLLTFRTCDLVSIALTIEQIDSVGGRRKKIRHFEFGADSFVKKYLNY